MPTLQTHSHRSVTRVAAATLLFSVFALAQSPDVEFMEVLVDPVGANAGAQIVEVHNRGPLAADLTGWHLVTPNGAWAMPPVTLPPGAITQLHLGRPGTSNPLDIYLPNVAVLSGSSSLAMFRSAQTTNVADLVDFVSWGGGQGAISTAVLAGQWPDLLSTVTLPPTEGSTIAHFDTTCYGSRSSPDAWFADSTPTLGLQNDGGGIFAGGNGCPQLTYPPQIGSGAFDNRPWLGELWRLDVGYLPPVPSTVFLALGLSSSAPIPLDSFGIPGCYFEVAPLAVRLFALPPSAGSILMQLPPAPQFAGLELRLQGLVTYPGANAANALPTRAVHAHLGLR
ncbi:MAG: hypothetical protein KDC98_22290 [Planctomycetes bacterium]|nr:hypothetical protein [Planctomycetota bacterium]